MFDELACLNVWLPYDEYVKKYGEPSKNTFIKQDDDEIVLYGSLEKITKKEKGDIRCMINIEDVINYDSNDQEIKLCKDLLFESDKKELNDKIKAILSMKDDWMWISKNMTAKHYDKDVESLLRKKYDKKADKELLKCSNDHKYVDNKKKDDKWLLQVLKSEYYILGNVIKNIHDQVRTEKSIEDKIKETIEYSKRI